MSQLPGNTMDKASVQQALDPLIDATNADQCEISSIHSQTIS